MLRVLIPRAWMRAPGSAVIVSLADPATLVSNRWTGATKLTVPRCWGVAPVALPLSARMLRADVAVPEAEPLRLPTLLVDIVHVWAAARPAMRAYWASQSVVVSCQEVS